MTGLPGDLFMSAAILASMADTDRYGRPRKKCVMCLLAIMPGEGYRESARGVVHGRCDPDRKEPTGGKEAGG